MPVPSTITERPFPVEPAPLGLSPNRTGGHMARAMMLQDLTELCRSVPADVNHEGYQRFIIIDNLLGRPAYIKD
jgi:hypothetical protein